ncbi:hypothetical protein HK101_003304 [Irineochytrium annulatum]|nr:hypothetical protein HK101_003304 [Irineochytrium annulatum]
MPIVIEEGDVLPWFVWRGSVLPATLPFVIGITTYTAIVVTVYKTTGWNMTIPSVIIPILTVVLGLLIAFRTNLSYDRFWEGRRLWSTLTSNIRTAARLIHSSLAKPPDLLTNPAAKLDHAQKILTDSFPLVKIAAMKLLVGYAVAVKHHLRDEHGVGYDDFIGLLPMIPVKDGMSINRTKLGRRGECGLASTTASDTPAVTDEQYETTPLLGETSPEDDQPFDGHHRTHYACGCTNVPLAISQNLTSLISAKLSKSTISPVVGGAVLSAITNMVDVLTNLDRILTTRIPMAYALHLRHILILYTVLLPYQLMEGLGWVTIPTVALAAFTLGGIEAIGIEIENPFGYDANDLPQDVFCNSLHREIDALIEEPIVDYETGFDYEGFLSHLGKFAGQGAPMRRKHAAAAEVAAAMEAERENAQMILSGEVCSDDDVVPLSGDDDDAWNFSSGTSKSDSMAKPVTRIDNEQQLAVGGGGDMAAILLDSAAANLKKTKKKATAWRFVSPSLIQRRTRKDDGAYARQLEQKLSSMETTVRTLLTGVAGEALEAHAQVRVPNVVNPPTSSTQPAHTFTFNSNSSPPLPPAFVPRTLDDPVLPADTAQFLNDLEQSLSLQPVFSTDQELLDSAFPLFNHDGSQQLSSFAVTRAPDLLPQIPGAFPQPRPPEPPRMPPVDFERLAEMMEKPYTRDAWAKNLAEEGNAPSVTSPNPTISELSFDSFESYSPPPLGPTIDLSDEEKSSLIDLFFTRLNGTFPLQFIHEGWHRREMARSPTGDPCPALTLVMCAMAMAAGPDFVTDGTFWPHNEYVPLEGFSRCEEVFSAAVAALDFDRPSVKMCQALLLMMCFCTYFANNRLSQGWLLGGMAMRMAPMLDLDRDPDEVERDLGVKWSWVEKEIRRRTFLMAYSMDCNDMILREQSSGLWHRKFTVVPQMTVVAWRNVDLETGEPTKHDEVLVTPPIQIFLHALGKIIARITDLNLARGNPYPGLGIPAAATGHGRALAHAPKDPSRDFDAESRALDTELRLLFNIALPKRFRDLADIKVFGYGNAIDLPKGVQSFGVLKTHIFYHAAMLNLHRPSTMRAVAAVVGLGRAGAIGSDQGAAARRAAAVKVLEECSGAVVACAEAAESIWRILSMKLEVVIYRPGGGIAQSGGAGVVEKRSENEAQYYFGVLESRCVLETSLHFLIVLALIKGAGGDAGVGEVGGVRERLSRLLAAGSPEDTRAKLHDTVRVLEQVSKRWSVVRAMWGMITRLIVDMGVA